jgi:hypothetical protein
MGLISLSRYFFERRSDELAWGYLKSAESKAMKAEQFDLLNTIYLLQIEHWHPEYAEDIHTIIEKRSPISNCLMRMSAPPLPAA